MNDQNSNLFFLALVLACFAILPQMQAASPPLTPGNLDGCYPNFTTAEGCDVLNVLTTGAANTGLGWRSLFSDSTGSFNTGVGAGTLILNTADSNTALGAAALLLNTAGTENVAVGTAALLSNDSGAFNNAVGTFALNNNLSGLSNNAFGNRALLTNIAASENTAIGDSALANNDNTGNGVAKHNTAVGASALFSNTDGHDNTAIGYQALLSNTTTLANTGVGYQALLNNTTGNGNTAMGTQTLLANTTGTSNTAVGFGALANSTVGINNIAVGQGAGFNVTTANDVICIGANGNNVSNSCYIGQIFGATSSNGVAVLVNSNGRLGTMTSSRRFKEEIQPMDQASKGLFSLQPVSFRYKKGIDPEGAERRTQFGLVAEDVEKVNPDLVVRDKEGKPYSVRYDQVNAMLLNEFLKEHKRVQELNSTVQKQGSVIAQQQARIEAMALALQKVSAEIQMGKSGTRFARTP